MLDKSFYNTVLCQTFSPCGKYLVAGSIYGQIAVFDINEALNPTFESETISHNKAKSIFVIEKDVAITALATSNIHLIVGTNGKITGWDWQSILSKKSSKLSWSIKIPVKKDFIDNADVNSLLVTGDGEQIIAGCGDNNLYSFSLEGGKLLRTYEGHQEYIHDIHGIGVHLVSAGEDGLLKLWDSRECAAHTTLEPYKNNKIARPDIGKWLGAAALTGDWIVCGGGPRPALWHLRALEPAVVFDLPDHGIHVTCFHEESVVVGGAAPHLYQVNYAGEVTVQLPVSATTVYSVVHRSSPHQVVTIAGSSPDIDLSTTFNYRDQVLHFST